MLKKKTSILRNIKYFFPIAFKKHPSYFILNFFLTLINSFSPLINIFLPTLILGELLNDKNVEKIIIYVLMIVLLNSFSKLLVLFLESRIKLINDSMNKYFSTKINYKTMRMDYEDSENPELRDLNKKAIGGMTEDTNGLADSMNFVSMIISSSISFISVFFIIVFSKTPLLILLSFIDVIIGFFIIKSQNKNQYNFWEKNTRLNLRFGYFFFELLDFSYAADLRLYGAKKLVKDSSLKNIDTMSTAYKSLSLKQAKLSQLSLILTFIIEKVLVYIVLIVSCFNEVISVTTLSLLLTSFASFTFSLNSIINYSYRLMMTAKYQSKYIDYMEYSNNKKTGTIIPNKEIKSIEFRNVSFKYPRTEQYILKNINITLKKERISLVGLNGSGKTTIVKLLCGFYNDYEGKILVNDIDIRDYDYEAYLDLFSIVFQDFNIISFTVKDNIENIDDDQILLYDTLTRAGLAERINELPNKELTYVNKYFDKDGVQFSGGEMQKIAIARALYKNGPIVILDEPTAALDPIAEAEIYYRFNEVIGNKFTLFISHRLSSCRFADKIIVLDNSEIKEIGNHEQLMSKNDGIYRKMFDAQAKYYQENDN